MATQDEPLDEIIVTLRKPVEVADLSFEELKIREPTAGELEQVDGLTGTASDIAILSIITGIPKVAIRKIGSRDFTKAVKHLATFVS